MIPAPRSTWARTTSPKAQELITISQRPAFLRPGEARRVTRTCGSTVSGDDAVGPLLGIEPAGEHLRQLALGDAVVLEDAGDARLDRPVRMIVGAELGLQVRADVFPRVAGGDPLVDVGMAGAMDLEA